MCTTSDGEVLQVEKVAAGWGTQSIEQTDLGYNTCIGFAPNTEARVRFEIGVKETELVKSYKISVSIYRIRPMKQEMVSAARNVSLFVSSDRKQR